MARIASALAPLLAVLAAAPEPLRAQSVVPFDSAWTEVARSSSGACELVVTGNGRFYRIEASGLGTGAAVQYRIENGAMKPIDWAMRADEQGSLARYYLPFRENHGDSIVSVRVEASACSLATSFAFELGSGFARPGIIVH